MAVEALCPICGAVFSLRDDMQGKKVRCTKCEQVFTAGGESKQSVRPKPAPATTKTSRDEDEEDRSSTKKSRPAARRGRDDDDDDDDDEDGKAKKKRVYHDDDEDDGDGKSKKKLSNQVQRKGSGRKGSGVPGKTFAIAGGALVLLLAVCGGGVYGVYRLMWGTAEAAKDVANNLTKDGGQKPGQNPPEKKVASVDDALRDLKSDNEGERRAALARLAKANPDESQRGKVAKALGGLLVSGVDRGVQEQAIKQLAAWGSKDSVPALTGCLIDAIDGRVRHAAMDLLGKLKDEQAVKPLVDRLTAKDDMTPASKALQAMGPDLGTMIEAEVIAVIPVDPGKNANLLIECSKILGAVGTKTSLTVLAEIHTTATNPKTRQGNVARASQDAINAINARNK